MRPIKFRAWDTDMREMVFVSGIQFEPHSPKEKPNIIDQRNDIRDLDEVKLMQFTGLYDKNGKEIYEGDKLGNGRDFFFIVEWDNDTCQFMLIRSKGEDKSLSEMAWVICEKYEIIGNIYEHEHLLK